jgi:exodeoxyribonuclease VII small subunit
MPKKSPNKELTFEDAVSELEEIVVSMEEDQLPLQELIDKFERGAKLHKDCEAFLSSAKKRLEIIANDKEEKNTTNTTNNTPESPSNADDEIRLF